MKVVTLLENTACAAGLRHAHGLSLYLEAGTHKILFDMGTSRILKKSAPYMLT